MKAHKFLLPLVALATIGGTGLFVSRSPLSAQESLDPPAFEIAPYGRPSEIAKTTDELERGHKLFEYNCASCHGAGHDHPGTEALEKRYGETKPAVLALRADIPPNLTKYYVRTGASVMPFFRKADISDADLEAIALYLARNIPPSK